MEQPSYPIKKIDNLGRTTYVDWNGLERSIYKYWTDTKKVKIKYRLYHQESSVDVYDKMGKNIISYTSGTFEINLPRLWSTKSGEIFFKIEKPRIKEWANISKSKKLHKTPIDFLPINSL